MAPTVNKDLDKAEKERESTKVTITWLEKQLGSHTTTPIPQSKIEGFLKTVAIHKDKIEDTFQRIVAIVDAADLDPHAQEYMALLDRVIELDFQFGEIMKTFAPTRSSSTSSSSSGPAAHGSDIRLPRINLPSFDGKIEDWASFRDMFQTAIHSSTQLSDAQKLTYLKAQLKGEAARQVQSLSISDANYAIAWLQLNDRYQNDRQLLFALLKKFTQQSLIVSPSPSSLRQLIDVSNECIRSLEVLGQPVRHWDSMLLYLIHQKLDTTSRELYEQGLKNSSIPKLQGLFDFLEQRSRALEAGGVSTTSNNKFNERHKQGPPRNQVHHAQSSHSCKACGDTGHPLYKCSKFLAMRVPDRYAFVKKQTSCFNCLRQGHILSQCPSSSLCRICNSKHHTLLHLTKEAAPTPVEPVSQDKPLSLNHHTKVSNHTAQTLLATGQVMVEDANRQQQCLRILLDGGSDTHIISSKCVKRLGLKWRKSQALVTGLSMTPVGTSPGELDIEFSPHFDLNNKINARGVRIMPSVTAPLPLYPCRSDYPHLSGLRLADEKWNVPDEIDMLIGAGLFYGLLGGDKLVGQAEEPFALSSDLGWLVVGEVGNVSNSQINVHTGRSDTNQNPNESAPTVVSVSDVDLDRRLRSFWELESIPTTALLSVEEKACEKHYSTNTHQREDGRFIVRIPFHCNPPNIGSSRDMAIQRLKCTERRLVRQSDHREEYVSFMKEYLELGHMERIPPEEVHATNSCYIPHHFVLKESSTTTKLRVVFDASSKTSNNKSINDSMMVGATIQDPLFNILLRFRTHPIAFTADIEKMYRQILIDRRDADYQRILWRESPTQPMQDFRLLTVTYGTAAAPFLATRTLHELAHKEGQQFPLAAAVALNDFYVDDVMSGADNEAIALQTQSQLIQMMTKVQWCLRKWTSNSPAVLNALPEELRETKTVLPMKLDHTVKALGVYWKPQSDQFMFKIDTDSHKFKSSFLTKRIILSDIARIFDPIGWLSPVVITAKLTMQSLWKLDLGWDDPVPSTLQVDWTSYKQSLRELEALHIPRCIRPTPNCKLALVGFCDASEKAYAAVAYLCVYPSDLSPPLVSLVAGKSRVAPSKSVSIPRLELCGAVLLAYLMESVQEALKLPLNHISAWTDSTVTLAWIQAHPSKWKRFVANRVTEVQDRLPSSQWGHVAGVDNPADSASRGLHPSDFLNFSLWWNGPQWLRNGIPVPTAEPFVIDPSIDMEERKEVVCNTAIIEPISPVLQDTSSLLKLKRVTAWALRFIHNCRRKTMKTMGPLQPCELKHAMLYWVRIVQQQHFHAEIKSLTERASPAVNQKSKILSLNPFVDKDGILRVGGRLRHAPISPDQRHPILLPSQGRLTQLLIRYEHEKNFHAGLQSLMSLLQGNYWIVHGRNAIRYHLRKCVICTRQRATTMQQMMADLPSFRVTPSRPFLKTGVDYAGPFLIRTQNPRCRTTYKAYLCLFVCCATRAVHLELVSDLTTEAFIASLRRFVSRRGRPSDIYSDNGTNFVGANRELKEFAAFYTKSETNESISNQLANDGINFHMIPPGSPNFGGLWEAGVKSVKYHLRRIMGNTRLTFEELSTTLTQVEAILNSRPLTAESSDPSDLSVLTPGHFLIGAPLTATPDADVTDINTGRLSRWQLLQQMYQSFWKRWSSEYLTRLQQRPKWMAPSRDMQVGDLVIIKDENLPPLKWSMGRVTEVHPGADGHVRVATLKTQSGILKRPVTKLCLLPVVDE